MDIKAFKSVSRRLSCCLLAIGMMAPSAQSMDSDGWDTNLLLAQPSVQLHNKKPSDKTKKNVLRRKFWRADPLSERLHGGHTKDKKTFRYGISKSHHRPKVAYPPISGKILIKSGQEVSLE